MNWPPVHHRPLWKMGAFDLELILFRHGIAIDREDPKCPEEPDRFLTEEGIRKTTKAALGLKALGIKPGLILSSPWLRAVQTAEIAAEALGYPKKKIEFFKELLPYSDPRELFQFLDKRAVHQVLVTGHAPHLDNALSHALGVNRHLTQIKKAGAACVVFEPRPIIQANLLFLLSNKALRKMG